jgi:hypothetical protein
MSILQQIEVTKDTECWTGLMRSDVIYADTKAGQVVTVVASDTFGSLLILVRDGFGVWVPAKTVIQQVCISYILNLTLVETVRQGGLRIDCI